MSYPFDDKENEFNKITREQLDSMSVAELLELLESINETMTEDNFDDELVEACLDAIDRKSPMPEYPSTNESLKAFEAKLHTAGGTEPELTLLITESAVLGIGRTLFGDEGGELRVQVFDLRQLFETVVVEVPLRLAMPCYVGLVLAVELS